MGFLALRNGCTVQAPAEEPVHSPTIMLLTPTEPPSTEPTHAHTSSLDLAAAPNSTVHSEPHIPAQRVHLA